jgi:hypothetical protein
MFCLFYLSAIAIEVALGLRERKGRKLKRAKKAADEESAANTGYLSIQST